MLRSLVFALSLVLATPAMAQLQSSAGPDAVVEKFFGLIQAGQVSKAYEDIGRGTLMEQKKLEIQNVANQTASMLQLYGRIVDWELMSEDKWSASYLERSYLMRAEKGPIFFKMHVYRSVSGWVIGNIYFTDTPANLSKN
jgi:hypothetical protein